MLFELDPARARHLLIADDRFDEVAEFAIATLSQASSSLVLFGSAAGFPFRPRPSTIIVPGMPDGVIASMPTLESAGIASRLASDASLPGCFEGSVIELASEWLAAQAPTTLEETKMYAVGSLALISAAEETARLFNLSFGRAVNRS